MKHIRLRYLGVLVSFIEQSLLNGLGVLCNSRYASKEMAHLFSPAVKPILCVTNLALNQADPRCGFTPGAGCGST